MVLQKTPLRLGAYDQDALNALTGQAGDMIYDSNSGDVLFYNGSTWRSTAQQFSFSIGADDSSMKLVSRDESIKIIKKSINSIIS